MNWWRFPFQRYEEEILLKTLDFGGNPYIGVYCFSTEDFVVLPSEMSERVGSLMADVLDVDVISTTLGGSTVLGSLACANSEGVIVTNLATETEVLSFGDFPVFLIPQSKLNAVGNNILCNDFGALVNPRFSNSSLSMIERALGVDAKRGTIAKLRTVGSLAVATNKGVICHPHATEDEMRVIADVLEVPVTIATANYGTPQLGACMVANSKGAVVGSRTTPIELGRIEEGLHLY